MLNIYIYLNKFWYRVLGLLSSKYFCWTNLYFSLEQRTRCVRDVKRGIGLPLLGVNIPMLKVIAAEFTLSYYIIWLLKDNRYALINFVNYLWLNLLFKYFKFGEKRDLPMVEGSFYEIGRFAKSST